jgi:CRP-like cAMP-binding protein
MSMVELVKGCSLFHEIYDDEIEEIIKHCLVASYNPGDFIMKQGDTSTDICILLTGEADISVSKEGKDQYITTLGHGDIFGELVLINETKRTANIVAKETCDVLILSYENFYSFYHKKPKVFSIMVLNVTRLITKRLKSSTEIIEDLGHKLNNSNNAA